MTCHDAGTRIHTLYGAVFETTETFRHPIPVLSAHRSREVAFRYEKGSPPPDASDLADDAPVFRSSSTIESGLPFLTIHGNDRYDLVRFSEVADFYIADELIRVVVQDPAYHAEIELYFVGLVLSLWMERHRRPVLHAAVVGTQGSALAFLAGNKSGKSSLALGFLSEGWSLLSDDLLPLDERSSGFWAHPGYPELRLWPDAVEASGLGEPERLALVHPGEEKRRVPLGGPDGVEGGRFAGEEAALRAVLVPRRGPPDVDTRIRPIDSKPEALRELIGGSFLGALPKFIGLEGSRLEALGRLVTKVPVLRLEYPSGWDRISEVVAEIEGLTEVP